MKTPINFNPPGTAQYEEVLHIGTSPTEESHRQAVCKCAVCGVLDGGYLRISNKVARINHNYRGDPRCQECTEWVFDCLNYINGGRFNG